MARSFLTPVNFNQLELQNTRAHQLGTAPATPVEGQWYWNTASHLMFWWNGTAWVDPLARSFESGTQAASTISDLSAVVHAYTLDSFAAPAANVAFNNKKAVGLLAPSATGDAATYEWVNAKTLNSWATPTANVAMGGTYTVSGLPAPTGAGQAATYDWTLGLRLNSFTAANGNYAMGGNKLTGLSTSPNASGDSAEYSWVLSRALNNFTGTITANIPLAGFKFTGAGAPSGAGDLATWDYVNARRLDQAALPTAQVSLNGQTLTGLATPVNPSDATRMDWVVTQVQSSAAGISSKPPARLVTTTNVTQSGLAAIDGVTPIAGDRILCVGQTTASQNGIFNASAGAWSRTTVEGPAPGEIETGAMWLVTEGTLNSGSSWRVSTTGAITVGTTSLAIVQFGIASIYSAGSGLSLTGGVFAAAPKAGGGLAADGTGIYLATDGTTCRKFSSNIGDGSSTSITVTHNLNTQDVHMQVRSTTTPWQTVDCDMQAASVNTATFIFAVAPTSGQYRVIVLG
jgi:hypothetical protein